MDKRHKITLFRTFSWFKFSLCLISMFLPWDASSAESKKFLSSNCKIEGYIMASHKIDMSPLSKVGEKGVQYFFDIEIFNFTKGSCGYSNIYPMFLVFQVCGQEGIESPAVKNGEKLKPGMTIKGNVSYVNGKDGRIADCLSGVEIKSVNNTDE